MQIKLVQLNGYAGGKELPLPSYQTVQSAGMDLYAAIQERVLIPPLNMRKIGTGVAIALPAGLEGQVRSRSGLTAKHWVSVLNSPGTIDSDYRGEIGVLLFNHGNVDYWVEPGERIAQLVICPIIKITWKEVMELEDTDRGSGGFGSTGS